VSEGISAGQADTSIGGLALPAETSAERMPTLESGEHDGDWRRVFTT
jgi:hypothetical protein